MFLVLYTLAFLALSHADVSHLGLSHGYQYEVPHHTLNVPAPHQYQEQHHVVTEVQQTPVHYHYEAPAAVSYQAPVEKHYEAPAPVSYQAPVEKHYEAPAPVSYQAPVEQHYVAPAPVSYQAPVEKHYVAPAPVSYQAPVEQHYVAPAPVSYQAPVEQHYVAPAPVSYQAPVQHQYEAPVSVEQKYLPPAAPAPIHVHDEPQAKVEIEYQAPVTASVEREYLPPVQQTHDYSVGQISHPAPVHEQTLIPSVPAAISYHTPEVQTYSAPASQTGGYHYGAPYRRFRS